MPRPNPPRKRPRRRPGAARADAELTRQTAQSTRPQQPPSKSSSGGSGGRGGGGATAATFDPEEMWSRRSYAVLVAVMAVTESVISLLVLGLNPGSKDAALVVEAVVGLNPFTVFTLVAAALLAAPAAKRITGERRPLRFVETILVGVVAYFIFTLLGIGAGILLSTASPSSSGGAPATPLPNATASPSSSANPNASTSPAASPSPSSKPSPSPTAIASATPNPSPTASASATPAPTAISGPIGSARSFNVNVPSAISMGQPFSVVVKAVDSHGDTAQGFADSVTLTSSDKAALMPAPYAFTAADKGQHTFQVTLKTVGSQTITATNSSATTIKGKSAGIVVAGPASKFSLVASNPIPANEVGSVSVTVQDNGGRRVTAYTGTIRFSSSDKQAKLPGDYTFTSGDCGAGVASQSDCGQHSFNVTFSNTGTQSVSVRDVSDQSLSGTAGGITVSVPVPVVVAAGAILLAISYAATVYVYPPLYKRLRTKPRPPAAAPGGSTGRK